MPDVLIYTKSWCGFCKRAKALLEAKGAGFEEVDIEGEPELRARMIERAGRMTVPQIFIGDRHVGGYDELRALELEGELDELLGGKAPTATSGDTDQPRENLREREHGRERSDRRR